jgi:hypothetical protein
MLKIRLFFHTIIMTIKKNIAFLLPFTIGWIIILGGIFTHTGYKEGYRTYFIAVSFICPFLASFLTQRSFMRAFIHGIFFTILTIIATELFWTYKDGRLFTGPDPKNCDGNCYGGFSFENDSPFLEIAMIGTVGSLVGSLITRGRLLFIILVIMMNIVILHTVVTVWDGLSNDRGKAQAAVLLGGQDEGETTISPQQQERADIAYELYKKGDVKKIFVGGYRKEILDEQANKYVESYESVVKDYLITKGITADDITTHSGWNPYNGGMYGTAAHVNTLAYEQNFDSVIIIGDYNEVPFAKAFFKEHPKFKHIYAVRTGKGFNVTDLIFIWRNMFEQYFMIFIQTIITVIMMSVGIIGMVARF